MFIAIDFDGTCVDHQFPEMGCNIPGAVNTLRELAIKEDHDLILFTVRSGRTLEDAIDWFEKHDIPLYSVNLNPEQREWSTSPKVHAKLFIDDKALGCPTMNIPRFERPVVDWKDVRKELIQKEIINH